eukprot:6475378-Pyramimonas_sp.AAC.1
MRRGRQLDHRSMICTKPYCVTRRDASLAIADSVVAGSRSWQDGEHPAKTVSYTHLTLPTILLV